MDRDIKIAIVIFGTIQLIILIGYLAFFFSGNTTLLNEESKIEKRKIQQMLELKRIDKI